VTANLLDGQKACPAVLVRRKLMSLLNQQSVDLVVDLKPSFSSRVKVPGMVIFIT
jgi:hypothetical protein